MAKIKSKPNKGTANRLDGRFDYDLPAPWNTDDGQSPQGEVSADTASLPTLPDGTPFLPLEIWNYGSPGEGRNDDDDGFFYDVLNWEIDPGSNLGFEQDVYIFQEAADSSEFLDRTTVQVRLKPGGSIKTATILIADSNSPPVSLGGDAAEQLFDTEGSGAIAAGGGNDILMGLEGFDALVGGAGNDLVFGGSGFDVLVGGEGSDELYGEGEGDTLNGDVGSDRLYGGSGDDALYGGTEDDILDGGTGNDTLNGEAGSDTLSGDSGNDRYVVDSLDDRIVELANEGQDKVSSSVSYTLGANLEDLNLSGENAIVGVGNELDNTITDEYESSSYSSFNVPSVNNVIDAKGGNDRVFLRDGNDFINGGDGDDTLNGGSGDDTLEGGNGNDSLNGGSGFNSGNDTLNGGSGNDQLQGGEGNDTLNGGSGNDILNGDNENDVLNGGDGDDVLEAGWEEDQLTGGTGADVFIPFDSSNPFFSDGIDTITDFRYFEGDRLRVYADELDIAVGDSSQFFYNSTTGVLSYSGSSGFEQLINFQPFTDFVVTRDLQILASRPDEPSVPFEPTPDNYVAPASQSLVGTANGDRLIGDENDDALSGLAGADLLNGQEGNDSLNGGDDADALNGGTGNDRLQGEQGHDNLFGEAGDDAIEGGQGSDTLTGGTGSDTLTGGTGTDRFNFYTTAGGSDRITDFNLAEDKIGFYVGNKNVEVETESNEFVANVPNTSFRAAGFTANVAIAASQFRVGTAAATSSDRIIYDSSTGALFFDADGTGATAQVQIATLAAGLNLNSTHILAFDDANLTASPTRTTGTNRKDTLIGTSDDERLLGLKGNDVLNGGEGSDRLWGGKGSDRLTGGASRDWFVLEKKGGKDTVRDFQDRQDRIGLATGLKFNQLDITQTGRNTLISFGNERLAVLLNVRKNQITKADFVSARSL
ncbi:hypothetical protein H6F67_01645 [Microcoleus sp. FACHB-1515]|uniref:calcium-binding protein n=1 Tax=Cyanophyceae TaxID=3028117 RepID=UPI00168929A1|nr:hypothetical protein [Microcoleus sp. FACHB-1515]MBD2088572.1 hypothetical protein [Microcoleus sp. FACHB-1515]